MALPSERHASGKGDIVEVAAIVFKQDRCFCAVHGRIAIAQENIEVTVVVDIAYRTTHRAPAAVETELWRDVGEGAITVIAPDPHRCAPTGAMACAQRIDRVLRTRVGELHDVEPAVVVNITAHTARAN